MAVSFFQREQSALRMRDLYYFRTLFVLIVLLWIIEIVFPAWRVVPLIYGQTAVPLHYNIHFGVDSVGAWWRIFTVPVIGLVMIVTNVIICNVVWKKEPMLAYVVMTSTFVLQLLLFFAMVFIVLLNISYG